MRTPPGSTRWNKMQLMLMNCISKSSRKHSSLQKQLQSNQLKTKPMHRHCHRQAEDAGLHSQQSPSPNLQKNQLQGSITNQQHSQLQNQ